MKSVVCGWRPGRVHVPYLSASAVVIHYKEALYQVYGRLSLPLRDNNGSWNDILCEETLFLVVRVNRM